MIPFRGHLANLVKSRLYVDSIPPFGLDFEFSRRLLLTCFLLSVSVSLVRPQTRMKSGLFEEIARKY